MEILSKKNAFWGTVRVTPNLRFTVPDEIGGALVARGMAEDITAIVLEEMEANPEPEPEPEREPEPDRIDAEIVENVDEPKKSKKAKGV